MRYYVIDTFTREAFKGNPTGVCQLEIEITKDMMQAIASELAFPVTAFLLPDDQNTGKYRIRYFTPVIEIPACGHATLASGKLLQRFKMNGPLLIVTGQGISISIEYQGDRISMKYPALELQETEVSSSIMESLSITGFEYAGFSSELESLFIVLADAAILKSINPDIPRMITSTSLYKEIVLTSCGDSPDYDYLLRSFCPWVGIDEDPVTGSVQSALAVYWKKRLGKDELKAWQCSPRGGELFVTCEEGFVSVAGEAVIVLEGRLVLPSGH